MSEEFFDEVEAAKAKYIKELPKILKNVGKKHIGLQLLSITSGTPTH